MLLAGLVPLLASAAGYLLLHPSFDESRNQPAGDDNSRANAVLNQHFPPGTLLPDYLVIQAGPSWGNRRAWRRCSTPRRPSRVSRAWWPSKR